MTFRADRENGDLFDALHARLARVLGREFAENALQIDATREGIRLYGYAALPTYSRGAAVAQYLFCERTARAGQDADRGVAGGLFRFPQPRPPSGGGAVHRL